MSEMEEFPSLRGSPLTEGLSDEQVHLLAGICYCRILENEEVLIEEGRVETSLHVITEGSLAVTRDTGGGEYTTIHLLKTGDLAGEMGFVSGRPHSATLRAVGPTKVCSFEREAFEGLLDQDPKAVYHVMQNIVQVVHDILRRMNAQYVEMSNYITKTHGRY